MYLYTTSLDCMLNVFVWFSLTYVHVRHSPKHCTKVLQMKLLPFLCFLEQENHQGTRLQQQRGLIFPASQNQRREVVTSHPSMRRRKEVAKPRFSDFIHCRAGGKAIHQNDKPCCLVHNACLPEFRRRCEKQTSSGVALSVFIWGLSLLDSWWKCLLPRLSLPRLAAE